MLGPNVADKYASALTKYLGLRCSFWLCPLWFQIPSQYYYINLWKISTKSKKDLCCLSYWNPFLFQVRLLWTFNDISRVFLLHQVWIIKYYVKISFKWFVLFYEFPGGLSKQSAIYAFFYTVLLLIKRKNLVEKVNIYNQQLNIWRSTIWQSIFDGVERICHYFIKYEFRNIFGFHIM